MAAVVPRSVGLVEATSQYELALHASVAEHVHATFERVAPQLSTPLVAPQRP